MGMVKVTPDVEAECQKSAAACWYSGLRMLFKWKAAKGDSSKDYTKILEILDQSPDLYPYEMVDHWGIDVSECRLVARLLGLTATGDGDLDAGAMATVLRTKGPVWVAGNWGRGNHVIVVTACDPDSGNLRIVNPYQNWSGSDSPMSIGDLNKRGDLWRQCDASVMYWK